MKNKEFLEINLSQFGVWEDLQMIYLLFIFNFLLLIELGLTDWAEINLSFNYWAHFIIFFYFLWVGLRLYFTDQA
jgi:hypothetical protein